MLLLAAYYATPLIADADGRFAFLLYAIDALILMRTTYTPLIIDCRHSSSIFTLISYAIVRCH